MAEGANHQIPRTLTECGVRGHPGALLGPRFLIQRRHTTTSIMPHAAQKLIGIPAETDDARCCVRFDRYTFSGHRLPPLPQYY